METVEEGSGPDPVADGTSHAAPGRPSGEGEPAVEGPPGADDATGVPLPGAGPEGPGDQIGEPEGADPDGGGEHPGGKDPLRFNNWMKRSATGAVMTGIAVGLQQALEVPKKQPAFVIVASDEPDETSGPIDLKFDPDSPADTVAIIRRSSAEPETEGSPPPS